MHKVEWETSKDQDKFTVKTMHHKKKDAEAETKTVESMHYLTPNRMGPCIGERCLLKCRKCTAELQRDTVCGHTMRCTCRKYMDHGSCWHIHMLMKEQECPTQAQARAGCDPDVSVRGAGEAVLQDHHYVVVLARLHLLLSTCLFVLAPLLLNLLCVTLCLIPSL